MKIYEIYEAGEICEIGELYEICEMVVVVEREWMVVVMLRLSFPRKKDGIGLLT
jgi:hypothetical protein